ncbi:pentapeptide repeat-containing protein [Floridanema aerugineum]|uniref:Pentapeptide repeat-containing protein n=1 Tax=Floridaenema aerugineum BLCC-F46 TaxID=3153654 RepID=A0ABV4X763_9CYAN
MEIQEFLTRYKQGERDFAGVDLSRAILTGINLQDINLTGANLTGANLSWSFFNRAQLANACLRQADLRHVTFTSANLSQAILSGVNLTKADLHFANLSNSDLNWAVLEQADLTSANLQGAKLDQSNLEQAKLIQAQLMQAELMEANLRRSQLINANLNGANLREANLELADLRDATLIGSNLTEANLNGVCLRGADLSEADLHRVIMTGADLSDACLSSADLSRANLAGSYLLKTSFRKAYLLRAILENVLMLRADLSEANFRGSNLKRADISGAYLCDTTLSETDLTEALFLESSLIRVKLDRSQMTGCCIYNWQLEDVDLSQIDCDYVYTGFNYATKSPTDRYPSGRNLKPGELAQQYREENSYIKINFKEAPSWEALIFSLAKLEQDFPNLKLTIKSFESVAGGYLLKISCNRPVNSKNLRSRWADTYLNMFQKLQVKRQKILTLLNIIEDKTQHILTPKKSIVTTPPPEPMNEENLNLYREVVQQIEIIIMSQTPEKLVESIQRLLNFINVKGIATEEITNKIIGQAILRRAKQDQPFQKQLIQWEKSAAPAIRLSPIGSAIRSAIAILWQESQ